MVQKDRAASGLDTTPENRFSPECNNTGTKVDNFPESTKDSEEKVPTTDKEISEAVQKSLSELEQEKQQPVAVGMFCVKPAKEAVREALTKPAPQPLFLDIWMEGELCCLYAKSGNGKSIEAVQAGLCVAQKKKVIYLDLELSQAQFGARYSQDGVPYEFPDNFLRADFNPDFDDEKGMDFISGIESMCHSLNVDTVIIDNLSWLLVNGESAEDAGKLMKRLMLLKKRYGWSILIVAHTPKKDEKTPITDDDIAGSKMIYNFIDSAFAIGKSVRGEEYRYIKEMKSRKDKYQFGASNVIVTKLDKIDGLTQHVHVCYSTESSELGLGCNGGDLGGLREMFSFIERPMRYTDICTHLLQTVKKSNGKTIGERTAKGYIAKAFAVEILDVNEEGKYYIKDGSAKVQIW